MVRDTRLTITDSNTSLLGVKRRFLLHSNSIRQQLVNHYSQAF